MSYWNTKGDLFKGHTDSVQMLTNAIGNTYICHIRSKVVHIYDVERGWSGANEHYTQQNSNQSPTNKWPGYLLGRQLAFSSKARRLRYPKQGSMVSVGSVLKLHTRPQCLRTKAFQHLEDEQHKRNNQTCCLLLDYICKPVLESADENVYLSEKKRNIRFKKKTVLKMGLP
jgi:hypothetical protein